MAMRINRSVRAMVVPQTFPAPQSEFFFTLSDLEPAAKCGKATCPERKGLNQCPLPSALPRSHKALPRRQWRVFLTLAPSPIMASSGMVPETGRPCGQHTSLSALSGHSWPTFVCPLQCPAFFSSANHTALLPFSIPASWCVSPV